MAELNDEESEDVAALSMGAKSLIAKAMAEDEPPVGAEEESWGVVASRVDEGSRAQPVAAIEPPAAAPKSSRWIGAAILALAIGSVVGLGVWVVQSGPPPQTDMPKKADAKHDAKHGDAKHGDAKVEAKRATSEAKRPGMGVDAKSGPNDEAATAKLLDEAAAALDAGQAARALTLLEQHAERSPIDPEVARRLALRIRTLCALDRIDDAKSEAAAFLDAHGSTKWAADVRASCAKP
ncbi:MAG TPA: hypothetical protein VG755_33475 [Nannocystaceae bacterium]|nr:hypothetical protein [Nannocystaceae bacterium]